MVGYVGFGNDELALMPKATAGQVILAPCGHEHTLKDSDPPMLLFYSCGDKTMLAGVNGRLVVDFPATVKGNVALGNEDSGGKA